MEVFRALPIPGMRRRSALRVMRLAIVNVRGTVGMRTKRRKRMVNLTRNRDRMRFRLQKKKM